MNMSKVWRNKSKYCWMGFGTGCPVPHELRWARADGQYFPPGVAVEADIDGVMNAGPKQPVMMFGPASALDAEVESLGIPKERFDAKQTKQVGENEFRLFLGADRILEDVTIEYGHAKESALGRIEIAKEVKAKDERISALEADVAASVQRAKELEAELAAMKAERSSKARSRLGL
jgi:hypothetical protein